MEWNARFEPDGSRVTITVTGIARAEGFNAYLDGVLGDVAWRPGMPVLVDFRGLQISHLRYQDVEGIVALHVPYVERIGDSPVAVLVSRPVDFGIVRMWESLAIDMFPDHQAFYRVDEALRWLESRRSTRENEGPNSKR